MKYPWALAALPALALVAFGASRLVGARSSSPRTSTTSIGAETVPAVLNHVGDTTGMLPAERFRDVAAAAERGIREGIYPGAVVIVGRHDRILYAAGYGHMNWSASSPRPAPDTTLWDIASLTKIVGTTSAAARLVDRGKLDLDAPVGRYLPAFASGPKARVTVRMLLDHTSGLAAYFPFHKKTRSPKEAERLLMEQPLKRTPGDSAVYSDLNMLVLGKVLERVTGQSLDTIVAREVAKPLEMGETMFKPNRKLQPRIMPTALWRGHPLSGEVNDPNAGAFGGVAGHAGIFTTGADLAVFAQTWLRRGVGPHGRWVEPATVRRFLTPNPSAGSRLLGWDTRDTVFAEPGDRSVFGERVSSSTYGHTGWTGVELWIDPERDLFLIFLTNRAFDPKPAKSIEALRVVRADLSNAVVAAVE